MRAIKTGDLGAFTRELATFVDVFIRKGTYLVLERARALVLRNLLKKIHRIDGSPQIKLAKVSGSQKKIDLARSALGHVRGGALAAH